MRRHLIGIFIEFALAGDGGELRFAAGGVHLSSHPDEIFLPSAVGHPFAGRLLHGAGPGDTSQSRL